MIEQLKTTYPKELIKQNQQLLNIMASSFQMTHTVFQIGEQFLTEVLDEIKFPIPVRKIAKDLDLRMFEHTMADTDSMEFNDHGAYSSLAQIQLREKRGDIPDTIAAHISLDKNMSEYNKRFLIAKCIGLYTMRSIAPIGPLLTLPTISNQYSFTADEELLAELFAYAILLPYSLVLKTKKEYEDHNKYNPLSYRHWIEHLSNLAQISEMQVTLGYEKIREAYCFPQEKS